MANPIGQAIANAMSSSATPLPSGGGGGGQKVRSLVGNWSIYLIFEVSEDKVHTFRNLHRNISARWSEHEVLHNNPRSEWQGPNNDEITMDIRMLATLGVKPKNAIKKLQNCIKTGTVEPLFIGGENYGDFYITNLDVDYDWILNQGEIAGLTASVTFKEYR